MSTSSPKIRALIADDEAFIRQVLEKMLMRLGIDVVASAENGRQAISLYKEHRPDIVILDIAMPEMDGLETLRALLEHDPNARVLMCTSFSSKQYVVEAVKIGASGYLNKPFDLEKIREKISKITSVGTAS
jgi:two-component system, chemotaxis family, chemotaxis protein CheY